MKALKVLMITALLCGNAWAVGLDKNDAGEYVLLNQNQQPTSTFQRYYLQENQWVMDGKLGNQAWKSVCNGQGEYRLQDSSTKQMSQWKALLPQSLQAMPMACINNITFAFCRISNPKNANQRLYWWFAWQNGQTYALGLNRIR
ncbi:hypothetical protein QG034_09020 [Kingella kingae]|uniref:hypothetical protein n=1 Tax=Kingella kingae TaxID=504 RepID=UPI0003FADE60|nr:hypothetical protein [Kingella kingae]MDK4526992.1 hypothetical protein [Kingella kingae]MDK4533079.1 hypothetical protein [Kingella kingae]